MKLATIMEGINAFCHKFLFFRIYHFKIQFIVSFKNPSHSLQLSTGVVKYPNVQNILPLHDVSFIVRFILKYLKNITSIL